jgi:hypothetical protein
MDIIAVLCSLTGFSVIFALLPYTAYLPKATLL